MESARVLLCEDETLVALELKHSLEQLGHTVVGIASTAKEAVEMANQKRPDIALMDINLKGSVSGTVAASRLATEFGIPSIYLTSYTDDATLEDAKRSNPLGYMVKPVSEGELKSSIQIGLSLHQKRLSYESSVNEQMKQLNLTLAQAQAERGDYERRAHLKLNDAVEIAAEGERKQAFIAIAAGIAHHLNNTLTEIMGPLEWLKNCPTIPGFESRYIDTALHGCSDAVALIRDLLWSSGQGINFFQFWNVDEILRESVDLVKRHTNTNVPIHIINSYPDLVVLADRTALKRALEAVIVNACEAASAAGEVILSISKEQVKNASYKNSQAEDGSFAVINIRDTGPGMAKEVCTHATEPFFTAHDNPGRRGMGLAVTRGVAESLGGWFNLESELNIGTVAKIFIPLCSREPVNPADKALHN